MVNGVALALVEPKGAGQKPTYAFTSWVSPIGVSSVPQNYLQPLQYDYLQYAVHEDRSKGAEQIYMGRGWCWIYSKSVRVTSEVIIDEEKQRHI